MKRNIIFPILFILSFSLSACSQGDISSSSSKEGISSTSASPISSISSSEKESLSSDEQSSNISSSISDSSLEESSNSEQSSQSVSSSFSYDFPKKEEGLTLEQIDEEINKIDPAPQEKRKVRYTCHIVEKLTGIYHNTMLDGSEMPEGEIIGDFVSETRNHNLDANIQLVSGTPVTQMQQLYARNYTSSITPKGWLSYHAQRRQFLDSAQEGEGFEERFYTGPLTLWMGIWGRRPANAQMDGIYFHYDEFERVYDANGYCTSLKIKEFTYMKGTLSSWNNGSKEYNGSYEYTLDCSIVYLDE